jgi:SAM-dependent methyltransferase
MFTGIVSDVGTVRSAEQRGDVLVCSLCGTQYPIHDGYAELLPRAQFEHTTRYAEDTGGHILDYRDFGQPLLSAQVKNNLLNDFLKLRPDDRVLDLGCGNGKFAYWNRSKVAVMLAVDTLCRVAFAGEMPPGVVTALVGTPAFIALLALAARRGS